jgi:prolyl-tRNA editing enzyme YbaK/EbsC (Cys-tRNA(Pro) deacylase)
MSEALGTAAAIADILAASGLDYEIIACDPALSDTVVFCDHYGYAPEISANTILVRSKRGDLEFVACLVLATTRLDVNNVVRKRLNARKVSFASAEETRAIMGMELGGVTALGLPAGLPLWVDARIMLPERIILGGGDRASKIIVDPAIFQQTPATEVVPDLAK